MRKVVDNSGTVTGSRDFSAFGAITVSSGVGLDWYAYTAREWDGTLNLQYTRARMYDPAVGRFLREDPLGLSAGDENLFRYAGNAHTLISDPSGLDWNEFSQHWHHLYPKQVFEKLDIKGLDINAKENGPMVFAKDHIGEDGLHPKGWNPDWQKWVDQQNELGKKITPESAKAQHDVMMKDQKFADALKDAKPATRSHQEQKAHDKRLAEEAEELAEKTKKAISNAAKERAKETAECATKKAAKMLKKGCKAVAPGFALLFFAQDI